MTAFTARIQDHFASLTDPRTREVTYPLINLIVIAACAVICGSDDFVAIADKIVDSGADYVLQPVEKVIHRRKRVRGVSRFVENSWVNSPR